MPDLNHLVLELATPHLRNELLRAESIYVHLMASGVDEQTGRRAPDRHKAFRVDIRPDGGLAVTRKTLEECGFA